VKHPRRLAALLAAALPCCYEAPDPNGFPGAKIASFDITDTLPIPADGAGIVHLVLRVDPDTSPDIPITVQTSSGVLTVGADAGTPEARTVSVKSLGTGDIPLQLRVGITPGTTLVTANVGGYLAQAEVALSASPPARIVLSSTKTSLDADGESKFDVTVQLLAKAQVSLGSRVQFAVCCPDADGLPAPCSGADPLAIAAEAELDSGQSLVIPAVTERVLVGSETPSTIPAIVVAQAVLGDIAPTLCSPAPAGAVRDQLALAVLPIRP